MRGDVRTRQRTTANVASSLPAILGAMCIGLSTVSAQVDCGSGDELVAQCPNLLLNGSPPAVGLASDLAAVFTRADDFTLPAGGEVKLVRFWGFYLDSPPANCAPQTDSFGFQVWSDVGGLPGEPAIATPAFEVTRSALPVAQVGPGFDVFEYTLVFVDGSVHAAPGVRYWVEVYNDLSSCLWYWLTTSQGNGASASRIGAPFEASPAWSSASAEPYDQAFSLCTAACLSESFCDDGDGALAACPCGAGAAQSGCDIAQGTGGVHLTVVDRTTVPNNRATVMCVGYPAMATPAAIVVRSLGLDPAAPVVFGDGLRCVALPLVRLGAAVANGGVSSHVLGHGPMAGQGTFDYQVWFRNTPLSFCDPTAAFNLTNGITLSW